MKTESIKPEVRFKDPWNILNENGQLDDYDKRPNTYRYHTKEEWWELLANGFADGGDCEDLFYPIVVADCNILRTNLLSVFDDICDTKEHTDDFFRCHPSADYIHKNTYLIRSTIHGYGTPSRIQDMRSDAWHLCCEKMDELVKKWYGVDKWGQQKVGNRKFDAKNLKPIMWNNEKFYKVFVCKETGEKIKQEIPTPEVLTGINDNEKYLVDRPVYVVKKGETQEVLIGHCRKVERDSLECGHAQNYDDEDMRYYSTPISFSTVRIVFHENTKTLLSKLRKKIGKNDIGVKFHLMTQCADNGDGWHEYGGSDEEVSKYNNTIFFAGTGWRTRDDGLHINTSMDGKWKERITIYPDRIVISGCEVPTCQRLEFEDNTRSRRSCSYFT